MPNKAIVLYSNVMRVTGNTTSYSGTEVTGFEVENTYDWRDFSLFRSDTGTNTVDTVLAADTTIDCGAVWTVNRELAGTILLQLETSPSVFTTLATFTLSAVAETLLLTSFTSVVGLAGRKVRWSIAAGAASLDVRQLCVGVKLENPIGQYVGHKPINLFQGIVTTNIISVNGSIIGRNYRRLTRRDSIEWSPLDPGWLRTYWEPFTKHASRNAFFFQWAPATYPTEVVFASAESIDPPENISPPPKMKVSMPIVGIAAAT